MDLKGDAQMSPEIEQIPLVFDVQVEYYTQAPAPNRNHGCGFVVGFSDIGFKIVLEIYFTDLLVQIPFCLN